MTDKTPLHKRLWRILGPGLTTGAADDDPSGVATYSQAGAQFGYTLLWTLFLTTPFMVGIQTISARIGAATGKGIIANATGFYPRPLVMGLVLLLLIANIVNIAADLAAMGEALRLVVGGWAHLFALGFGLFCLIAEILIPYRRYAHFLKFLTLSLFAYVATALIVHVPWGTALKSALLPQGSWKSEYWLTVVAILGTTISPYLFFWQAAQEVEESGQRGQSGLAALPFEEACARLKQVSADTWIGMLFSNLVAFFILVTAAVALRTQGITNVQNAAQAAQALRPLAGEWAFALFAAGIIGTGLLAVPVLAGSGAYAVADLYGWRDSLELAPFEARGFYAIVALSTLFGAGLVFVPLDPIRMLFWSAVVNGIVAVPIMVMMMGLVRSKQLMGRFPATKAMMVFGWGATILMGVALVAMAVSAVF